jgi:CHASE2 domain-containing sensor protein
MKKFLITTCLIFLTMAALAAESPFVIIMYDNKTEAALGAFPPKRTVWANTVDKVQTLNAKAVVLKFFFDLPRDEDIVLSDSIQKIPTFLQACINDDEPSNNQLDERFTVKLAMNNANVLSGNNGWLPVKALEKNAYDVGFVDIRDINNIPIIENYNGKYVKSLYYCLLQYVFPDLKMDSNYLVNDHKKIKLNNNIEMNVNYPIQDNLKFISLCDVLNNTVDSKDIENKIVIIGYDGNNSETLTITTGKVKKHRVFIYGLFDMYNQLK